MKAFGYVRISGQSQINGHGFERQEEEIRRYCTKFGVKLESVYREEAVSGTKDEGDRPALQDMITAMLSNGIRTVIVEGLDRLARELRIQEALFIYLASKGITLISARTEENVTEAIQDDPMRKALVQMQGVFSELEKNLLVKKLRKARDAKRSKDGRCEGRKPLNEANPDLLKTIRRLRRKRPGGVRRTHEQVAQELNMLGFKTSMGKDWTAANVANIVKRF